jgi:hypothetical protein
MKYIKTVVVAGALLLCMRAEASAQDWYGLATWNISFPTADTKEFVDETSFRGFNLEFRKAVDAATTVGIMSGWDVFHERTDETVEFENGAVTGSQDRYINAFPIMLGVHRYLGERGGTRPYLGVNAGGWVLIRTARIGISEIEEDSWDWGVIPEAGLVVPMSYGSSFIVNGRYQWSFTSQDLAGNDEDLTYWSIHIGFAWEN